MALKMRRAAGETATWNAKTRGAVAVATVVLLATTGVAATTASAEEASGPADQQYRPLVHYTPEQNWMNDPNGMVFHDGVYHLYYQHNPAGTRWGNMSWGHATSPDLLTWEEQPLAIAQTFNEAGQPIEDIFSGSVVVDETNSSGFGTTENPPLVAIYTSAYTPQHRLHAGKQAQSLAYSLDDGYTWTKFAGNPVLDRNSANFRDPKVFWYDGPAGQYWVMAAVEATQYKVVLYRSDNLKDWTHLSDFGPANSTGGIWECPDLFEVPVDGDPENTKWVMVVNLNPGAVAGGSGGQYFVGEFDGTTFTSESIDGPQSVPDGTLYAGFDDGTYNGWTVSNEPGNGKNGPWGTAPASGSLPGQNPVSGFVGAGLVNGFNDFDWPIGRMDSPTFTISQDYVNFLVGGGRHPHVDGSQLANDPPAGTTVFDFELPEGQTLAGSGWTLTGDFAAEAWRNPSTAGGEYYLGAKRVNTHEGGTKADGNIGLYTSPTFALDGDHVSFLIGGGARTDGSLQVELVVDGDVVRTQTGPGSGHLNWRSWDVTEFAGSQAQLRIRDEATGDFGHLTFDHVVVGDEPAKVRSDETSVNLVVNGQVVRTATGNDGETLDWASWNVAEYAGQEASIRIVDNNRGGWGHILADQVMFADAAAPTRLESYDWLDWGKDYYATVSYFGAPDGKRIMHGWMSNWDYANDIPTSTWRSSMALPREVALVTTPEGSRLTQKVVAQIDDQLDTAAAQTRTDVAVDGGADLDLAGDVVKIDLVLRPGDAEQAGIAVFGDAESETRIGYDTQSGRVFIDRRDSGNASFHPAFASVDDAPVQLAEDGTVTLEFYLDRASVELFAADGRVTITDQVFPNAGAQAITGWSVGGSAVIESITVTPIVPTMWTPPVITGSLSADAEGVAGEEIAVGGSGFAASTSVQLQLDGVAVKDVVTDGSGAFATSVALPVSTSAGEHVVSALVGGGTVDSVSVRVTAATLDMSVSSSSRCTAGKVTLTVQVRNHEAVPATVTVQGPYGSKTVVVAAGKTTSFAFTTRQPTISGGELSVTATGRIDGHTVTAEFESPFSGRSC